MGDPDKLRAARQRLMVRIGVGLVAAAILGTGAASLWLAWREPSLGAAVPFDAAVALGLIGIALGLAAFRTSLAVRSARGIAGVALGFVALFPFRDSLGGVPGVEGMAPVAAIGFALLALGLLLTAPRAGPSQALALVAMSLGLLSFLGRLYGIALLYQPPLLGELTPLVALLLTLAGGGILFLRPERGLPAALLDRSEAGGELRRLTATALLPVVLGWLVLTGMHATGRYQSNLGTALLVITIVLALSGVAYWSYTSLRRAELERRRTRAELAANEVRYRRTFEHARIGIAHLSPAGRWLQVNQRLVEILGYAEPELLERTYADVSHLEDLEVDIKQWELLRRGEISDYAVERRFTTKAGETVYADVRIAREEDASGALRHFIVVLQDVTARRLSDGTRRVYERALAATQNGVVITDACREDQPIVYANPAFLEMTGYTSSELIGKNCRILNERAREQAALDELRQAIAKGQPCSVLVRNHRKNGGAFWNQLAIAPIEDATGRFTHFVGVMVDATERVEVIAEREELLAAAQGARHDAESANRAKDRFLSVVSHELRSPLNAILAWTSLLRDEPGEEVGRVVKAIEASVHSQSRLVNELLDASRIREGTLQIEPTRIDLEAVVRKTVNRLAPIADERGIALELDGQGPAPAVADAERIEQVVRNLLDNALKFTPRGGRVQVQLLEGDEIWGIEVRDNGRGISAEALSHVFQEFWQEDGEGSGQRTGLGLGLMIVKHLVEHHGGSVRIESEGKDRGTKVRVELPRASAEDVQPAGPSSQPSEDLKGVEIVVVDDDDATVQALGLALVKTGALCRLATSVSEALRFFELGTPDAVVSDIGLPDRSGFDLIRSLRGMDEPNRSVVAIAVTGLVDPEERRLIRRAGFDAYLAKPVAPDVVIDRLLHLRSLQAASKPPARRVLILEADAQSAAQHAALLREAGHDVRQVAGPAEALCEALAFRPHIVLARTSADPGASALSERLAGRGVRADLVGLGDDGPDLKGFDRIVPLPLDLDAIDRLLRFTEDT